MSSGQAILSLTGNCFFQDRPSAYTDPRFLQLVQLLRGSDCAMTNLEFVIHDGEPFPAYVAGGRAASYLAAPPHVVAELKWMGINLVYAANNHVHDFAEDGVMTTIKYLKAGGLAYAGIGPSLTTSTAPGYYQTDKGRVALVSASDWGPRGMADIPFQMPTGVMPGDADAFFKARPGINLLRYDAVTTVDKEAIAALKRISKELGWEQSKAGRRAGGGRAEAFVTQSILGAEQDNAKQFHFMGRKFMPGKSFGFFTEAYEADLQRNFKWVREARRTADFVVAALHDQGSRRESDEEHVRAFCRGSIDAGADIAVAHGGRLGGIEIYKGKVILYGCPPFYFQNESIRHNPPELKMRYGLDPTSTTAEFLEERAKGEAVGGSVVGMRRDEFGRGSVLQQVVFDDNREPKEVRLYPLEFQSTGTRTERGRALLAEPGSPAATTMLERAAARSKPYGTEIKVQNGIGIVRIK